MRGLPPAEKETWDLVKIPYQKGYNRFSSPRAWMNGELALRPPDFWKLGRTGRRIADQAQRSATNDGVATRIIQQVAALMQSSVPQSQLEAAPKGRPSAEQVYAYYKHQIELRAASALSASVLKILPPLSEVGGYISSVHTTPTETPKLLSEEQLLEVGSSGRERWRERELAELRTVPDQRAREIEKTKAAADAFLAKTLRLAKERGEGG